jgi:hypothetical protein
MALTFRPIAISTGAGCIVLIAFALGWWEGDDGSHGAAAPLAGPEWLLPKPIASDVSTNAQILAQKPPFGAPAANAVPAGPQTAPGNTKVVDWRVGGIVMTEKSGHLIVLIRRPGDNVTRSEIRNPGEELPDGSILRTVEPTNVMIERQGAIVTIKMFAQN